MDPNFTMARTERPVIEWKESGGLMPIDTSVLQGLDAIRQPGETDLVVELIGLFIDESERCLAQIEAAVISRDLSRLQSYAHRLRGSSASLGATQLAAWCRTLEVTGPMDEWPKISALVGKMKASCAHASEYLTTERDRRI